LEAVVPEPPRISGFDRELALRETVRTLLSVVPGSKPLFSSASGLLSSRNARDLVRVRGLLHDRRAGEADVAGRRASDRKQVEAKTTSGVGQWMPPDGASHTIAGTDPKEYFTCVSLEP